MSIRSQYLVLLCQHIRHCVNHKRIILILAVALLSVLKLLLENKKGIEKCVLELCLIATKIEGFKSLLQTYGMRCI